MGGVNNLPALSNGFTLLEPLPIIRINDRVIKAWADILTKVPPKLIINSKIFNSGKTTGHFMLKFKEYGISETD